MAGLQSSPISNQYSSNSSQVARARMTELSSGLNIQPKSNGEILLEKLQQAGATINSQEDLDRLNNIIDKQFKTSSTNQSPSRTSGGGSGGSYSSLEDRARQEQLAIPKARTSGGGGVNSIEGYTLDTSGQWISNAETAVQAAQERGRSQTRYYRQQQEREAQRQEQDRQQRYINNPLLLNQTLANLIDSGADAQANLFEVTILGGKDDIEFSNKEAQEIQKNLTFRINNFNAPAKQLQTQDLPYQTASLKKVVPGSSLTRQLDFNIRLDYNYQIYWYLHRLFAGDSFGNFDLNLLNKNSQDYVCTIQVKALSPKQIKLGNIPTAAEEEAYRTAYITSPAQFDVSYSWTFFDCYLIQIPQVAFGYEQTGSLTPTFSFIFGMMTEGIGETGLLEASSKTNAFSLSNRNEKLNPSE